MLIETRKGFLKDVQVLFDDEQSRTCIQSGDFSRLMIMSYNELPLPDFEVLKNMTSIIKLGNSPDEVLSSFNKTARNEISRTVRDPGIEVHVGAVSDDAYRLYKDFETSFNRKPYPKSHFDPCIESLVYVDGTPASGIFFYPTSPVIRIRSIFSLRRRESDHTKYQRIGFASRRAMFEVCKWGIDQDRSGVDLAKVNLKDEDKAGISQYKLSFGGTIVPEYTYVFRKPLYAFFERLVSYVR